MKCRTLFLAAIFFASITSQALAFPRLSFGNSELIGSIEEKLIIPLSDFEFLKATNDKGSHCLNYKSLSFPRGLFRFIHDRFDRSMRLEEYADWYTQSDFSLFPFKERTLIYGGREGKTDMISQKWENHDVWYYQLFFGRGREGFACTVILPKTASAEEFLFWENFFAKFPFTIDFMSKNNF